MKNFKLILLVSYALILILGLSLFFYFFDISDLMNYEFLNSVQSKIISFKETNLIIFTLFFIIFCIIWLFVIGIGIPLVIITGMVYEKLFGTLLFLFIISLASTTYYMMVKYFFYDYIKKNYYHKYNILEQKFKKNEFLYFLLFKLVEGIPFAIANSIPVLFNVRIRNVFICTFIGLAPSITILIFLGSGLDVLINNDDPAISIYSLIYKSPEIYLPIIIFIFILIIGKKLSKFFKIKN